MEKSLYVLAPENPSEYLHAILKRLGTKGATVNLITQKKLTPEFVVEKAPHIFFIEYEEQTEVMTLLRSLQKQDATRSISVFPILKNENSTQTEMLLESGAADVLSSTEPLEASMLKLEQATGQALARAIGSDIDITPDIVPTAATGTKVFVVEDDSLLKNLLEAKLSSSNIICQFAATAVDALEKIIAFSPSVIILDIMLPGANGLDLLEDLRKNPTTKSIPVIIFSNRDEQKDRNRATELGAEKYFVKAMTELTELVTAIEELAK